MKESVKIFLKSIIVGLGGVAPGLSGSVLMIIFGLYRDTLDAFSTLFVNFKKKISYLFPLISGMLVGVFLFGKIVNFFFDNYTVPTRYAFLGLIIGTVPLFYQEIKKEGFSKKYYVVMLFSFLAGLFLFTLNTSSFSQLESLSFIQKILLGLVVVTSAIVPGVDQAVLLTTFGMYDIYINAIADLDFSVLLPMALGMLAGAVAVSFIITRLFNYFYTASYSVIFGVFISIIPNMIISKENSYLTVYRPTVSNILIALLGFAISYYMKDIKGNNEKIGRMLKKRERDSQ